MSAPALGMNEGLPSGSAGRVLNSRITGEQHALRWRARSGVAFLAVAVLLGLVALMVLVLGDGRWMTWPRVTPVLGWIVAAGGAAVIAYWRRRRHAGALSIEALAWTIEKEQRLRAGSLRGALEVSDTGVLGARAAQDVAARLGQGQLAPRAAQRFSKQALVGGALALVGALSLAMASRAVPDGLSAVLHPVRAWTGTLLPALAFERLPMTVPRGMPITLQIIATGRSEITVSRRAEGEAWRDTTLSVPEAGRVALPLGPVRALTLVRVNDGRAPELSARLAVEERGWVGDVALRAQYPAYLGRSDETLEPVPPLRVPRGTRVQVQVGLHGGARDALLTNGRDTVALAAGDEAGQEMVSAVGTITIDRDEQWTWTASATPRADGVVLPPELPDELPFTVIPDMPPSVNIVAPVNDTLISPLGSVPVTVQASDDHRVAHVQLLVWRETQSDSAPGERERIEVAAPLAPLFEGGTTVALDGQKLVPGDRVHLVAVAIDDSPWRQQVRSSEVVLRVPTLAEQRAIARALADSLAARALRLAQQERLLQRNTADASQNRELMDNAGEQSADGKSQGSKGRSISFAQAEKARGLARDQQELSSRVDSLRQDTRELEARLKSASALDTLLAARMAEVQKLLREALTPEMQKQLEELNRSTDRLSGSEVRRSMQQLAEQQRLMREQLERSAEMLKRAALEGAMQTLRDDASDLAEAQQQLARQLETAGKQGESGQEAARESRAIADRTRSVENEVEALARRLYEAGAREGALQTREAQPLVKEAADAMQKAAEQLAQEQAQQRQQDGQDALSQVQQQSGQNARQGQQGQQARQQQAGQQGPPQGQQGQQQSGSDGMGGAADQARRASESMNEAARQLTEARDVQVGEWKEQLSDELDKSINETMQLARQQADLEQRMRQAGSEGAKKMAGEQSTLQQGVQQAAERLEQAGRTSSLLSQRSQMAMADAQRRVQEATQAMQQGQSGDNEQMLSVMKDASEALNKTLSSLVRDRERVNGAQSASGFTEMMEQLKQLAQQQGQLNDKMEGLNLMPGGAKGDQAQEQARVLARQQRDVARDLMDVADNDQTGRTDALAREAQTLALQIERSGLNEAIAARQQQLYRRLLDAGRFLEQEERDDLGPRESKAGTNNGSTGRVEGSQSGPAAQKFVLPTWNELRGLGPEERRIVIEYFRRINGSGTPP